MYSRQLGDRALGEDVALLGPGAFAQAVGRVADIEAEHLLAGRRQHGRGHRRAEAPDHRLVRQPAQQHVGMGLLDIVERRRDAELRRGKAARPRSSEVAPA